MAEEKNEFPKEETDSNILSKIQNIQLLRPAVPIENENIRSYFENEINNTISEELFLDNYGIKKEIYIILVYSVPYCSGLGNSIEGFNAKIFPLIIDENIGNPNYLSRENGIKISLTTDNNKGPTGNTIWAYEKYATYLINQIYNSHFSKDVGFVSVLFIDKLTNADIICLTLNAADAENYKTLFKNNESYISSSCWSEIKLNDSYPIIFYENIEDAICINSDSKSSNTSLVISKNDNYLADYISEQYFLVLEDLNNIKKYNNEGDYQKIKQTANNLNEHLYIARSETKKIQVSQNMLDIKEIFLKTIDNISFATSDYWYSAALSDNEALQSASVKARKDLEAFNDLVDKINIHTFETEDIVKSDDYQLLNAHSLFDAFHYQDKTRANDISARVTARTIQNCLLHKDLETTEIIEIQSEYNTDFLIISVDFTHLGYRGGATDKITTPSIDKFKLFYKGEEYNPLSFKGYLQNSGVPYKQKKLERKETYEAILVFEIKKESPDQFFDDRKCFLNIDLDDYGIQTWSLEMTSYF
ncbi:MAG: hypothetical protein JXQ82_06295 [Methanomicrobiaceae archaeon]|nr:hypothetical protein [Methanomicrobiaceae archaeon]